MDVDGDGILTKINQEYRLEGGIMIQVTVHPSRELRHQEDQRL